MGWSVFSPTSRSAAPSRRFWNDPKIRAIFYQVAAVALVGFGIWFLVSNTLHYLSVRNIATGFDFLGREAGFAIGESLISYTPADTYARALSVGLLNTLRAAVIGIVLATILGTLIGVARLSSNWLVAKLASTYVEVMRNIPLLLQLFFWYALISESLPAPRQALNPVAGVFLSNRGFEMPSLEGEGLTWLAVGFFVALMVILITANWASARQNRTGRFFHLSKWARSCC